MFQSGKSDPQLEQKVTPCVRALLWAAGRLGVAGEQLVAAVDARPDDPLYRPLRIEAVAALADTKLTPPVVEALIRAARSADPALRPLAAGILARGDKKAAGALADKLLADNVSFTRVAAGGAVPDDVLKSAVRQVHYQGVALPHFLARRDLNALGAIADDHALPMTARLGALEGLASLATEDAEGRLLTVARRESEEEDLRKAAWRGLRRSRRARKKKELNHGSHG